jgi:hypothetical protein
MSIVRAAILRRASEKKLYADNGYAGFGGLRPHPGLRKYKVSRAVLERSRDKNVLPRLALKYDVGRRRALKLNKRTFVAVVNDGDVIAASTYLRIHGAKSATLLRHIRDIQQNAAVVAMRYAFNGSRGGKGYG